MDTGLYVHFPWCVRKCPYCDFNSHPLKGTLDEASYVDCLLGDLDAELRDHQPVISTIYFGGGTPSLFSPESFARLLAHPALDQAVEITMEANPGTIERGTFEGYRSAGITRVSIGVQSFDEVQLAKLGRIHSSGEAARAVEEANAAGFDDVNLDLMFALPGQSIEQAERDLEQAVALGPSHISWYQLTIEPKTEFARRPPVLPTVELKADMSERGLQILAESGYTRYEVSAFGKDGSRCAHNVNYWRFGDYIGIGAGAHGKRTTASAIQRIAKPRQPRLYLDRADAEVTTVHDTELPAEFMMNVLRLKDGVPLSLFTERTGLDFSVIADEVAQLVDWGLMQHERLALTDYGYAHLDSVVARFIG